LAHGSTLTVLCRIALPSLDCIRPPKEATTKFIAVFHDKRLTVGFTCARTLIEYRTRQFAQDVSKTKTTIKRAACGRQVEANVGRRFLESNFLTNS
jgi:hypothetical protein